MQLGAAVSPPPRMESSACAADSWTLPNYLTIHPSLRALELHAGRRGDEYQNEVRPKPTPPMTTTTVPGIEQKLRKNKKAGCRLSVFVVQDKKTYRREPCLLLALSKRLQALGPTPGLQAKTSNLPRTLPLRPRICFAGGHGQCVSQIRGHAYRRHVQKTKASLAL